MKSMLEYVDEKTSDRQFYFGTDDFDHVWERLIDTAFGVKDKDQYFPRTRWLLDYGRLKDKKPLMPDESLKSFYERFGFYTMLSGQFETYESE